MQNKSNNKQSVNFFSYYWHHDTSERFKTCIRIYGLTEDDKSLCAIVDDFQPYVYIELPRSITWDSIKLEMLYSRINELCDNKLRTRRWQDLLQSIKERISLKLSK